MSKTREKLLEALREAKNDEFSSKNTAITREIASLVNRFFRSRDTKDQVTSILKTEKKLNPRLGGGGWVQRGAKRETTKSTGVSMSQDVADKADDVNAPQKPQAPKPEITLSYDEIIALNNQEILDRFGTMENLKDWVKANGFIIPNYEQGEDYFGALRDELEMAIEEQSEEALQHQLTKDSIFLKDVDGLPLDKEAIKEKYETVAKLRNHLVESHGVDFQGARSDDDTIKRLGELIAEAQGRIEKHGEPNV